MVDDIIIAAKCAPQEKHLEDIEKAGLRAVELYISEKILGGLRKIIKRCNNFPFRYAVHAPNAGYNPQKLADLVKEIGAEIVVFHNIYWEDEWEDIVRIFQNIKTRLCTENTYSVHESLKFMRRYGLGRSLDLEHLQLECCGLYEEECARVMKEADHVHLTGYVYGSQLWHTHIHYSPGHSAYLLNLLKKSGYSGFVVSEAKSSLQTYSEFKKLNKFYQEWRRG